MKVVLVGSNFKRVEDGVSRYGISLVKELKKRGIDPVTIDRGLPRFPFIKAAISNIIEIPIKSILASMDEDVICHFLRPPVAYGIPFIYGKRVATIQDLIAFRNVESGKIDNAVLQKSIIMSARHSDVIISGSEQTKKELIRDMKIPEEKIVVVNHGVSPNFKPLREVQARRRKRKKYIIGYLGPFPRRKNISMLVESFDIFRKRYPKIDAEVQIWGAKIFEYNRLKRMVERKGLKDRIRFMGYVPERKIVETYNSFNIFVFPSLYEGFGLPIMEAQACGLPVVLYAKGKITPEVSKFCLKARNKDDMAEMMHNLWTDRNLYLRSSRKGREYAKQFTWEKSARETIKVYKEISK